MRYIVAGAPCSGKSTYVKQHFKLGDVIYDYDLLHSAISSRRSHDHDNAMRKYVVAAREAILDELQLNTADNAFVISSSPLTAELARLRAKVGAESKIILMNIEREEAHRRCNDDGRPSAWHDYIDNWFDTSDIDANQIEELNNDVKGWRRHMNTKTFQGQIAFKADGDGELGEFKAIFSTFGIVDKDGDLTLSGAFKEGAPVRISYWGHRWQDLPVGRGVIHQDDKAAWVDGKFFLDTQAGKETYLTVKGLGDLQEWSYGYDILDSEMGKHDGKDVRILKSLEVPEVSPVLLGAGIDTRTEAIKTGARHSAADDEKMQVIHDATLALGAKCAEPSGDAEKSRVADSVKGALPPHSTDTTDAAWDGPAMDARCPSERAALRATHAWVDPEGDPDVKSSYKFIHHVVSGTGEPGAANIRAAQTGIGVLNGGRGGTTIPDADRKGVWNHLAKHLRDADVEPPELKSADDQDQTGDGESRNPSPSVIASLIKIAEMED